LGHWQTEAELMVWEPQRIAGIGLSKEPPHQAFDPSSGITLSPRLSAGCALALSFEYKNPLISVVHSTDAYSEFNTMTLITPRQNFNHSS
jgi:hypothetical protein